MPAPGPLARVARYADPLLEELDRATSWRVCGPPTIEAWLLRLSWQDLWWGDEYCRWLAPSESKPKRPPLFLLTGEVGRLEIGSEIPHEALVCQLMHRLLFARDLYRRMPRSVQQDIPVTGDLHGDFLLVTIRTWYSSTARVWARDWGHLYGPANSE